jgi:NAD(P)-dependent dehydrogenase (short-subunit alcohol dehydrogenase family)
MLEGRVAIITGSGQGIGAALAHAMAAEGAAVVVNDLGVTLDGTERETSRAELVASELRASSGQAVASTDDIADFEAAEHLVRMAVDAFGRLDILVNAAGILRNRMIWNMTEEEWDAVVRVHLRGTFCTTRHAANYWRAAGPGRYRLINFTSGAGLNGSATQPNYAAAKMGIVGFTMSCANALGRSGVTANCIAPSAATRMSSTMPEDLQAALRERDETPENVAPAVLYVASDRSDWLTGRILAPAGHFLRLFNVHEIVGEIRSDGPWELGAAFDAIEREFRPIVERPVRRVGPAAEADARRR